MLMLVMGNILNGTSNVKKKKKKEEEEETQFLWKPEGEKKKNLENAITKNRGI